MSISTPHPQIYFGFEQNPELCSVGWVFKKSDGIEMTTEHIDLRHHLCLNLNAQTRTQKNEDLVSLLDETWPMNFSDGGRNHGPHDRGAGKTRRAQDFHCR